MRAFNTSKTTLLSIALLSLAWGSVKPQIHELHGLCDASGAVSLDSLHFVVANDENQFLHTYLLNSSEIQNSVDLSNFLLQQGKSAEADLEASAKLGNVIYWIGSHGVNKKGKQRPSRHVLFSTQISEQKKIQTNPWIYRSLAQDLHQQFPTIFPHLQDLNIEGLAIAPSRSLYVGMRAPLYQGKAIIVAINNLNQISNQDPSENIPPRSAMFQSPFFLDLKGHGIRSLEFDEVRNAYWMIAGPSTDQGSFSLWKWSGIATDSPVQQDLDFQTLIPEALFVHQGDLVILSDDGSRSLHGKTCKDLDPKMQSTRWIRYTPKS